MFYHKVVHEHAESSLLLIVDPDKLDLAIEAAHALCASFNGFSGVIFTTEAVRVVDSCVWHELPNDVVDVFEDAQYFTWFYSAVDVGGDEEKAYINLQTMHNGICVHFAHDDTGIFYETEVLLWEQIKARKIAA